MDISGQNNANNNLDLSALASEFASALGLNSLDGLSVDDLLAQYDLDKIFNSGTWNGSDYTFKVTLPDGTVITFQGNIWNGNLSPVNLPQGLPQILIDFINALADRLGGKFNTFAQKFKDGIAQKIALDIMSQQREMRAEMEKIRTQNQNQS